MTGGGPARRRDGDLILDLHVQPRAARDVVAGRHGERIKIRLAAAPVEGKANTSLLRFLAEEFGVPKKAVNITSGHNGRLKTVVIQGPKRKPGWLQIIEEEPRPGK